MTVIVPAYNAARWLEACLESVTGQRSGLHRLIVVDDGSDDATAAIADRFALEDPRCRAVHIPHSGVSAARNVGLDASDTEWVLFLDADDVLHPQALGIMLGTAMREPETDIVVSPQHYGDVPLSMPVLKGSVPHILTPERALGKLLLCRGIEASMSGRLYRRSLFETGGRLRFRKCRYEDLDLGYRVMERARKVALLDQKLYFYRRHEDSFIRSFSPARFDVLDVTDRMYEHFLSTSLRRAAADRRFAAHCNVLLLMYSYGHVDSAVESRCVETIRRHRRTTLTGRGVRVANRAVAATSYFIGIKRLMRMIAGIKHNR